jgi:predicted ATPase
MISYDFENGTWSWNLGKIMDTDMTDNVVEMTAERIQNLPSNCQHILSMAACIGNQFVVSFLIKASQLSFVDVASALWKAYEVFFHIIPDIAIIIVEL